MDQELSYGSDYKYIPAIDRIAMPDYGRYVNKNIH